MEGDILTKIRRSLVVPILKMSLLIGGHLEVGDLMVEEGLVEKVVVCSLVSVLIVTK